MKKVIYLIVILSFSYVTSLSAERANAFDEANSPKIASIPCIHPYYICNDDTAVKKPENMTDEEIKIVRDKMMNAKSLDEAIALALKVENSKRDVYLYYAFYQVRSTNDLLRLVSHANSAENKDAFLMAGVNDVKSFDELNALANAASSPEKKKAIIDAGHKKFANDVKNRWHNFTGTVDYYWTFFKSFL
ncbi:MAG: hypothetical protein HQM10_10600 [Candidatus Riflebacteria bacterium]|nr:hypothetical protein [Candidatus Riflebacteria bacterium]